MIRTRIDRIVGNILVALMAIMTLDVLWGVLTRYAFGDQASWSEELARFLLIWIGILGAAWASGQGMHLAIDLLRPKLKPKGKVGVTALIHILIILFAVCALIIGGMRLIYITYHLGQLSAALRVPMYVVYSIVPISGFLVVYYSTLDLIAVVKAQTAV